MRAISFPAAGEAARPRGFWRQLAQALDELVASRSRRALPATQLRRCQHDVDRCRRLMLKNAMTNVPGRAARGPAHRAAPAAPTRR